ANWLENTLPVNGSTLVFDTTTPGFTANPISFTLTNNLTGLTDLVLVLNDNSTVGNFNLTGNAIGLAAPGITSNVPATAGTVTAGTGGNLSLLGVNYATPQTVTLAPGGTLSTPFGGFPASTFAGLVLNQGTAAVPGVIDSGANSPLTLTGGVGNTAASAGLTL